MQARGFTMEYLSRVAEVKDTVDKQSLLCHLCALVLDRFTDSTDLFSEIPAISRAAKVPANPCVITDSTTKQPSIEDRGLTDRVNLELQSQESNRYDPYTCKRSRSKVTRFKS